MSAYGHQMEREISAQTLSSRQESGTNSLSGSRYTSEMGIHISSLAATVFISGLATLGVSLLSLLVALTVMLQSCQNRNSGVLEIYKNNHDYCKNFAVHAELNSLDSDYFPKICKNVAKNYVKEGQYGRDLRVAITIVEDFFNSVIRPDYEGRDIVLMDADDFFDSASSEYNLSMRMVGNDLHDSIGDANNLKHTFVVNLYLKLQFDGWPIILLSRKHENLRNITMEHLKSVGCRNLLSLIMRKENETQMDSREFLSSKRNILQHEGFRIKAVISSQMDALMGTSTGDRVFKIPNPIVNYNLDLFQRANQEE